MKPVFNARHMVVTVHDVMASQKDIKPNSVMEAIENSAVKIVTIARSCSVFLSMVVHGRDINMFYYPLNLVLCHYNNLPTPA